MSYTIALASLIVQSASAAAVIAAAVLVILQIRQNTKAHRDNHDWNRRIASHHALNNIFSGKILPLSRAITEIITEKMFLESNYEIASATLSPGAKVSLDGHIRSMLNFWEEFCVQINNGVLDEHICYLTTAFAAQKHFEFTSPWIELQRHEKHETHLFIDFTKRVGLWKEKWAAQSRRYAAAVDKEREEKPPIM